MLLLNLQQALMNKDILFLGLLLNRSVPIDSSMTPDGVRAYFFQLSFELGQRVVIEKA